LCARVQADCEKLKAEIQCGKLELKKMSAALQMTSAVHTSSTAYQLGLYTDAMNSL